MNDVITTANAKAGITFKDDTKVQITEQSKLVIDTFVYDGEKKTGKLGIKMALGTIKYASGQIAKNDPQQVMVETPTATIGVRGTDFSGTVDETGRSTIILLPSCPVGWRNIERDCVTGNISVTTIMGTIWLTKPFEAVVVNTVIAQPKSAILNLSLDQINNIRGDRTTVTTSNRKAKRLRCVSSLRDNCIDAIANKVKISRMASTRLSNRYTLVCSLYIHGCIVYCLRVSRCSH